MRGMECDVVHTVFVVFNNHVFSGTQRQGVVHGIARIQDNSTYVVVVTKKQKVLEIRPSNVHSEEKLIGDAVYEHGKAKQRKRLPEKAAKKESKQKKEYKPKKQKNCVLSDDEVCYYRI